MRIAYTMNGIFGGFAGKNSKSNNINESELILKYTYSKLKKYILDNNNIDLFIFSWHHELKDEFNTIMSPTRLEVCEQIDFKPFDHLTDLDRPGRKSRAQAHISKWYGYQRVMNLVKTYEQDHNFKYDLVVNARMDMCWNKPYYFDTLDNTKFHITQYADESNFGWPNRSDEIVDHIFASNSDTMFEYSNLYDKLFEYTQPGECPQWSTISNHFLMVWHLRKMGLLDTQITLKSFNTMAKTANHATDYDIFRYRNLSIEEVIKNIS